MLQRIREGISGPVAWTILALLALVFAVWGINMDFTPQTFAVKVNGEEIPAEPIRRQVQDQLARFQQVYDGDIPEELQTEIRNQVVEQAVLERLLAQRIGEQGYRVSDAELSESIREMPVFQVGGQFSMDSYQARVRAAGYTTEAFEEEQRRRFEMQQLQDALTASSFVTDAELAAFVRLDRERREAGWVAFQTADFAADIVIDEADVVAHYESNIENYQTPEEVDLEYVELRVDELAAATEITDEELLEFYEAERSRSPELFVREERRRASHVLVAIDDDTDDAAALAAATEIRSRIAAGEELAAIARERSDDAGSAEAGGDLGWVEPGMMVAPFEEALFALEDGGLSEPVRTRFGYHVIRVDEIDAGSEKTFEEAREELADDLRRRRAEDAYYESGEMLAALSFENPDSLAAAAEGLGVDVRTVAGVSRSAGPGIAGNDDVRAAAFDSDVLEGGENSPVIEIAEDHAVVIRIADHRLPAPQPIEEVRERIVSELTEQRAREQLGLLAEQTEERLAAGEEAAAVAADIGGEYHPRESLGRTSAGVPVPLLDALFAAAPPAAGEPTRLAVDIPGGVAVAELYAVEPGRLEDLADSERDELRARLAGEAASRELIAYLAQLRSDAAVVVIDNQIE